MCYLNLHQTIAGGGEEKIIQFGNVTLKRNLPCVLRDGVTLYADVYSPSDEGEVMKKGGFRINRSGSAPLFRLGLRGTGRAKADCSSGRS